MVVVPAPSYEIIVLGHGPDKVIFLGGGNHIFVFLLKVEFWAMDADDHQAFVCVLSPQVLQEWVGVDAVDAAKGLEIDQNNAAAQFSHGQRTAIDPGIDAAELRRKVANSAANFAVSVGNRGLCGRRRRGRGSRPLGKYNSD